MKLTILLCFVSVVAFAHPGIGIVEDSRGNIYYTDLARVWKVTPGGQKSVAVQNVHTHELYLDENDNLFGEHLWYNGEKTDTWGHYAWKLSNDGKFKKVVPDSEGFLEDYSFVRDHFGRMYWAERSNKCQHVVRKNNDSSTTILGDECLGNIRWMTSASDGSVYVVDEHDLKKINTQGKISSFGKITSDYAGAPTVDKQNNIYIADYSGKKVSKIAVDGTTTVVFKTSLVWGPMALIVAKNGDYLVLETSLINAVRVERITKDKKSTVY